MLIGSVIILSLVLATVLCLCCGGFGGLGWLWLLPVGFVGSVLLLAALIFAALLIMARAVRKDIPQESESRFYRWVIQTMVEAAHPLLGIRVHARGLEQTPTEGRFLLVCNHLNDLDPIVLLRHFPKSHLAFITKKEVSGFFLVGKLMHKILCQPLNRENDREALKTILRCIQLIKEDKASIAVFPEGYTSLDRKLHHFRSGVFKIAQKTQVPIVVCTLTNTWQILSNRKRLGSTDVELHLLGVIRPEEFAGITTVELGERIYNMMLADLGPEYALEA